MSIVETKSFVSGKWVPGLGEGQKLVNPATEEVVAKASTEGVDMAHALEFARAVGGKNLRAMTFRARGEMIRAMSRIIHQNRDALITLAIQNGGNTRSDAKFDIDGASGTLAFYADLGAELGDKTILADGDAAPLGRSPRLCGQHIFTPRAGVAVHVNAFNFPAWGLCEKAAVALLAGMPVVSKPATSTALVAHRIMELFDAEKMLPDGALSLVCGRPGSLLDHLTSQDVLAFTGSSDTGRTLRSGKRVLDASVRVNVEADSLNAAVLGPDAEIDGDVMNLFLTDVVRDMQQKTGQKCTAIRRVYVPKDKLAAVVERLNERLATIKVGDPSREEHTMGPLSTADQLRDVTLGAGRLVAMGKAVFGSPTRLGDKGYFMTPVLVVHDSPSPTDAAHQHEVFGPVATVMPYDGSGVQAAEMVSWGTGGLVSSLYSDDKAFVKASVVGMAPFNGRVTIGSSKIAAQAIPPGLVLPSMIHGGPGRAGAGEELGGRRGLAFYMQRTALQGDRALLDSVQE